jgi:hypothetical protein
MAPQWRNRSCMSIEDDVALLERPDIVPVGDDHVAHGRDRLRAAISRKAICSEGRR